MLLSEMLGVERDTDFGVKGYESTFKLTLNGDGAECLLVKWSGGIEWRLAQQETLCAVILRAPANIIHLPPPLTDEEKDQLRGCLFIGYPWLTKDKNGTVYLHSKRPVKCDCFWDSAGSLALITPDISIVRLVSWEDAEPFNIAKALETKR